MKKTCEDTEKNSEIRDGAVKVVNDGVKSLSVMICDDEEEHILKLQQILEQLQDEMDLHIDTSTAPEQLLKDLEDWAKSGERLPNVIFLDISMPEIDGIAFGKMVRKFAPDIYLVFTTAYREYAVEGYEARAFRYLLKPITRDMVLKVLNDILIDIGRKKKLLIKLANEERVIPLCDIIYMSAEDKYTVLYTTDGYYLDRTSLTEYEKLLGPYGFIRIHRKHIVNFMHHRCLEKGYVVLGKGIRLPISKRREAVYHMELFNRLENELIR